MGLMYVRVLGCQHISVSQARIRLCLEPRVLVGVAHPLFPFKRARGTSSASQEMGDSVRMTKHRDVTRGSGLRLSRRRSVTTHLEHSGGKIESGSVVVCSGQGLNLRCVAAERVIVCNRSAAVMPYEREGVFTCPEDNLPLDYAKIYPDPDAEVAIMGSVVYCIHYKEGCKWSDELRKLQGHLNMCKFDAIPCTNHCGAMIPRLVMDDHRLYTCPKRLTRCEYCAREFTGEALEGHVGSCQLEPIYCENKCGSKIQRRHQNQHRQQECTKRLVPCRYCQKEFVYDTLQIHTAKCPRLPVSCPNRCDVLKIAKEDLETHLSDHCTALTLSCTFKDMGCKFKGTRSALDQHLEDGTKPHLLLVCGVVSRQQHHINALRTAMQGLTLNTSGTLLWRITDYSRRLLEAREGYELCSTPFYTSQYGYKLMATLFMYGNGAGEGTHLSIYIKILPGEYDALLQWPFSHTVTFILYDQTPTVEQACNVVESFVPDPTWKNFQRPSKEPDALGFGFPRFVSHEILKKRSYVKDDVMYIKVKVDGNKTIAV